MLSAVGALVRLHDRRRFVTALFAPPAQREVLFTLYAFNHELARAREVASHPTLALIRLQWWREVVDGAVRRHDVASPLRALIDAGVLPAAALLRMIDGRAMEAEENVETDVWEQYLADTSGTLMDLAGTVLGATGMDGILTKIGAGCGAVAAIAQQAAAGVDDDRWLLPSGLTPAAARLSAARWLGAPRPWPRGMIAAALPAVFARRFLAHRPDNGPASRLAVWAAATRSRA